MRKTLGLLLLLGLAPVTAAQDEAAEEPAARRYVVEFIVFAYAENVGTGTEVFPPEAPPPGPDGAPGGDGEIPVFGDRPEAAPEPGGGDRAPAGAAPDTEFIGDRPTLADLGAVPLPAGERSLDRIMTQLQRLDVYEPLLYAGWVQDAQPPAAALPVPLGFFGPPPAGLEGSFTLYLGRYLHLVVDLALAADDDAAADPYGFGDPVTVYGDERPGRDGAAARPGRVRYRIGEDRIVKNEELRYFDHPKFGVIAKVTRVEEPADPAAESRPLPLVGGSGE